MACILVIDDDPLVRYTLKQILEEENHEVIEADNGKDAFQNAGLGRVDLMITDIIMPEMEGIETIMKFRQCHPDIEIIAISGGGRFKADVPLRLATRAGATSLLTKPFGVDELLEKVREGLRGTPIAAADQSRRS